MNSVDEDIAWDPMYDFVGEEDKRVFCRPRESVYAVRKTGQIRRVRGG